MVDRVAYRVKGREETSTNVIRDEKKLLPCTFFCVKVGVRLGVSSSEKKSGHGLWFSLRPVILAELSTGRKRGDKIDPCECKRPCCHFTS